MGQYLYMQKSLPIAIQLLAAGMMLLGNAPAQRLFELVQTPPSQSKAPRCFADYTVTVDEAGVPAGVTLTRLA